MDIQEVNVNFSIALAYQTQILHHVLVMEFVFLMILVIVMMDTVVMTVHSLIVMELKRITV